MCLSLSPYLTHSLPLFIYSPLSVLSLLLFPAIYFYFFFLLLSILPPFLPCFSPVSVFFVYLFSYLLFLFPLLGCTAELSILVRNTKFLSSSHTESSFMAVGYSEFFSRWYKARNAKLTIRRLHDRYTPSRLYP